MTYTEALAPYTPSQQMKLAFAVLSKVNHYRGPRFNMIAEATVDQWDEDETHTTDDIIDIAHDIWASAGLGDEGFAGFDEAMDLAPLIRKLKREAVWIDRPKGWSRAA